MATRRLIVNADDFGLTAGVNRGILAAHLDGMVTSASLMVRRPAAAAAAALAARHPRLGLGLHLDLGDWDLRDGAWKRRRPGPALDDAGAIAAEIEAQLARFQALTGRVADHVDSHQHVHLTVAMVGAELERAAGRLGIPVRRRRPDVGYVCLYAKDRQGRSWPEAISTRAYVRAIGALPPGVTELACHPGEAAGLASDYREERELELAALRHPDVALAVREVGVELITWAELRPQTAGAPA